MILREEREAISEACCEDNLSEPGENLRKMRSSVREICEDKTKNELTVPFVSSMRPELTVSESLTGWNCLISPTMIHSAGRRFKIRG